MEVHHLELSPDKYLQNLNIKQKFIYIIFIILLVYNMSKFQLDTHMFYFHQEIILNHKIKFLALYLEQHDHYPVAMVQRLYLQNTYYKKQTE